MRTLALLGGLTYESTALYYKLINEHVRARLGPQRSAPLFLYSVDQAPLLAYYGAGDWDAFAKPLIGPARVMVHNGQAQAQAIVITANLAHRVVERIEREVGVEVLHCADYVAGAVRARGMRRVGLLATRAVMEGRFFVGRMEEGDGSGKGDGKLEVLVPESVESRKEVDRGIVQELTGGKVSEGTREMLLREARDLKERGAEGLVLGSTDLGFVFEDEGEVGMPLFDSARIHAIGVAEWAIQDELGENVV